MNDTEKAPMKKWQIKAFTHTESGRPALWWQGTIEAPDLNAATKTLSEQFPLMMNDATALEVGQVNERAPRVKKGKTDPPATD